MDKSPRIVYVCSLCLRQYDLQEDLRGHMVYFHGYEPIAVPAAKSKKAKTSIKQQTAAGKTNQDKQTIEEPLDEPNPTPSELQPMPFKDFRLVLRSTMLEPCSLGKDCPFKFQDAAKMQLHSSCHKGGSFSCCECGLELPNWRRCSAHLWKTHQVDVDLLECPALNCNYKSPISALVWRHMRVHKKWRPRVLRSLAAVQRRRKLKEQPGEMATQPTAPPPAAKKNKYYAEKTCEICNRKFVNGKTLSKHVKTVHNKIKPFICNVCGKKTARKASLIIHMRQHTGEKPLQCGECKFSTRDPSVLHKHRQRHDSQETRSSLKCSQCEYFCIQANALKRHMRLNHADAYRDLCCDLCSFTSINAERLQAHKQDHRKGLITNCEDSMDATRAAGFKYPRKLGDKNGEISADCFMPLESVDSLPHEPAVDTGGVTIPAPPSEDTQFPTYLKD
ncbi:zinc finger protein 583 isoform X1 [Drosophila elegans]|uniref:zinc finger protein 583 isoform X1 n=1 Tax=Drosophila elegans TaxID=30023 RepID=UPI0007E5DE06|nr:zinc finger protein 583 isoform X1 [Drosophila elegans]